MISLGLTKHYAKKDIDSLAGQARLRYTTDVPGQQAVYLIKLEQARQYKEAFDLDPTTNVPSYILMESQVMGITPIALANQIISIGNSWNDVVGPSIESIRISTKAQVDSQTDIEEIANIVESATNAFNAV